jgi:hypothetical protein
MAINGYYFEEKEEIKSAFMVNDWKLIRLLKLLTIVFSAAYSGIYMYSVYHILLITAECQ